MSRMGVMVKYWKPMPSSQAKAKSSGKSAYRGLPAIDIPVARTSRSPPRSPSTRSAPQWLMALAEVTHLGSFSGSGSPSRSIAGREVRRPWRT